MKNMQSFLAFFYILDNCYKECKEDCLGGLLGACSPEMMEDGFPIDMAIFQDWVRIAVPGSVNVNNVVSKINEFLNYYQDVYGDEFTLTKTCLKKVSSDTIVQALQYADSMYNKHKYDD